MSNIKTIGNITGNMLTLISKEGQGFSIDINSSKLCMTVTDMLDNLGIESDEPIDTRSVDSATLEKVLIFCDYIQNNPDKAEELTKWTDDRTFTIPLDEWFVNYITVDQKTVYDVIMAANFLNIQSLLQLGAKYIASLIRNKSPEELKTLFANPTEAAASGAGPA